MSIDLDEFDFGFTAVDENELEAVQKASEVEASALSLEEKVNKLYNSILPLLSNLKKNPEKEYIHWPNRVGKIEEFEDLITKIVKG